MCTHPFSDRPKVKPFDYALGLITILVSLGLNQIIVNLHRLFRRGRAIRWDGRPLIASALVTVEIIRLWFAQWTTRDLSSALTFRIVLADFFQVLVLVLLAASALPDAQDEDTDLAAFHEANRRYFWGLFACYQATYFALWLFVFRGGQDNVGGQTSLFDWIRIVGPLGAYSLLATMRVRVLDYALPLCLLIAYLALYWNQALAA